MKTNPKYALALLISIAALGFILVLQLDRPTGVRGKSPARPATGDLPPEALVAQDVALSDPAVIALTTGRRTEVFSVIETGNQYTLTSQACARTDCRQVNIYNFDENILIAAIVDVETQRVLDLLEMPGQLPAGNDRLHEVAVQAIMNAPEVEAQLGWAPAREDIYLNPSTLGGTDCGTVHPCLAAVFPVGDRLLWAHVDLTTELFAGIGWTEAPLELEGGFIEFVPEGGCPTPGNVNRDGWQMDYSVTSTDGLRLDDVRFNNIEVMTSAKLAEWHADYGLSGFVDAIGCGSGGGQFAIFPYGITLVLDLLDGSQNVIGFEIVQDFRMGNWGAFCNYRYEQHYQFFQDGRFRVVGGAYGKGCDTVSIYRPLIRIDLAINGDASDQFASWDGAVFTDDLTEFWASQTTNVSLEGYAWLVKDTPADYGFYIEPGQGHFGDGGRGDNAFIYVVQHHANEGDADLAAVGTCCNDDHEQGPDEFINGEPIESQNLVLWYIPQFFTVVDGPPAPIDYYCWTITGEPDPETYPCFGGPMFHPFGFDGATPTPTATATATPTPTPTPTATSTPPSPPNTWIYLPVVIKE
jgi:hypothetical protein